MLERTPTPRDGWNVYLPVKAQGKMPRIFISYSRKDLGFVRRLAGDLEKAGYEVWWDLSDLRGSDDWTRGVSAALEASDYSVVVLSQNSAASERVEKEYTRALALHKKIIPILLERSEVPFALNTINYVDFTSANYAANLKTLLTTLRDTGGPAVMRFLALAYAIPFLIGVVILLWPLLTFIFIRPVTPAMIYTPARTPGILVPETGPTNTGPTRAPNNELSRLREALYEVDQQFQKSLSGNIAYTAPQTMKLENTVTVELLLNPSESQEALATQIVERSNFLTSTAEPAQLVTQQGGEINVVTGDITITSRMKAVLKSLKMGAFEIQELHDSAEQPISSINTTKWRWAVTAKEPGQQTLELLIYRLIIQADNEYWLEVEAYRADINVQVTPAQRIRSLDWKWILGILVTALLIPLFFRWYDTRKKEANEPKPPEPPKRKSRKK